MSNESLQLFTFQFQISQYLLFNHEICDDMDECFKMLTSDRTKALAISRAHALNNPFGLKDDTDFYCFPVSDDVVIYSAVMMFRRFHYLLPIINEKIRAISESGLLTKWQKDSFKSRKTMSSDAKGGHGSVQMKLRLDHVEGAFLVVLIGLSIAFIIFLIELLIHWLIKKKKSHWILKTMERLLCHA